VTLSLFHDRYIDHAIITRLEFQMPLKSAMNQSQVIIHPEK